MIQILNVLLHRTTALLTVQNNSTHLVNIHDVLIPLFKIWHQNYFTKLAQSSTEGRINFLMLCMERTTEREILICMKEVTSITSLCYE